MVEMDGAVGVGGGGGQATPAQPHPRLWRLVDERSDLRAMESDYVRRFHRHEPRDHQCSSAVAKHIKAPVHLLLIDRTGLISYLVQLASYDLYAGTVWSLVRRFDQPQLFKPFVSRCEMKGNIEIGSVRENYSSILTVHPEVIDGRPGTLVIESFVVDVPDGNTKDETCYFVEALLKCNLKSLAEVSENRVTGDQTEPLDR
ncbi:hypothetical protein HU200_046912 [Digitaria exilis]|uniref:Uncharacterized protein n=1 Tax=Digitaria exilis TaxID=1010633 RepID=A0A835EDD1_9POAL|nr:hypothetical protein HU200_046912 [Digitaria exilis]